MSVVSKAALKNDFADGQIITESTMDDLIDSTYNPNLVAGTDITLVSSGNDITINSTGGGGTLQDVLTAGSVGWVPTLIDIRSTGVNNFFIEAGNDLNLWGLNDVIINGAGGDTMVQAQDNINLSTAAIAGTITLASGDIVLTAQGEVIIPFADTGTAPLTGQVLAAKTAAGDMEWVDPTPAPSVEGTIFCMPGQFINPFSGSPGEEAMEWVSNTAPGSVPLTTFPFDVELIAVTATYIEDSTAVNMHPAQPTPNTWTVEIGWWPLNTAADSTDLADPGDFTAIGDPLFIWGSGEHLTGDPPGIINVHGTFPSTSVSLSRFISAGQQIVVRGTEFPDGSTDPPDEGITPTDAEVQMQLWFRIVGVPTGTVI